MRALDRKLVRDLWHIKGQALAIALVVASGVAMSVMSLGMLTSLEQTRSAYYERYRFADIFATVERAPDSLARKVANLPGVSAVETRIVLEGLARAVYTACEEAIRRENLPRVLGKEYGIVSTPDKIEGVVADLERRKLLCEMDGRLVALAVRGSLPGLPSADQFPGGYLKPVKKDKRAIVRKDTMSNIDVSLV